MFRYVDISIIVATFLTKKYILIVEVDIAIIEINTSVIETEDWIVKIDILKMEIEISHMEMFSIHSYFDLVKIISFLYS